MPTASHRPIIEQVQSEEKDEQIMFPNVGDITNAEVKSVNKTYAMVELDCGYIACLPGRGYIEGEIVEVRVTSKSESRSSNQPSLTIEAV